MGRLFYFFFFCLFLQFAESAYAYEEIPCNAPSHTNRSLIELQKVNSASEKADLMAMAWSCTRGFFSGVWDATGGRVGDAWDCVTSPIDCANSAVTGVKNAWNFVKNISAEISAMYDSFRGLTTQQKADILCELIGNLGATVAIGILVAGPGSAMAAKAVAELGLKMQKLSRILRTIKNVSHRKVARLKDDVLNKVDELTQLGYGRFMRDAIEACPL